MKKFKNIDELITALKDGSFDVPVHVDRKNKMFIPVFKKIISDVITLNASIVSSFSFLNL